MLIADADSRHLEKWDSFVDNSINGTIFHKIKFLKYHGSKFSDGERFLVILNGNEVYAQISIHVKNDESGRKTATSPYGASYGGFVFKSLPSFKIGKKIVDLFLEYLKANGIEVFNLTQPSNFLCKQPLDTFILNFLEAGLKTYTRDIENVFKLDSSKPVMEMIENSNNRTIIRKAQKNGIVIKTDAPFEDAYPLIESTAGKFGKKPTHSRDELLWLSENFKEEINFVIAYYENKPIASVTNFELNKDVNSSFYISSDKEYLKLNAVRYAIYSALRYSRDRSYKYYTFGRSSSLFVGTEAVFATKEDFSRVGLFRETLRWEK